jgi:hypothetical protein
MSLRSGALEFLESISDDDIALVLYNERLSVLTDDTTSCVGRFSIMVSRAKHCCDDCLLVQAASHGKIGSATCGTTLTAYVDVTRGRRLETLKHQQHEYIILEGRNIEKETFIVKQGNSYLINCMETEGQKVSSFSKTVSCDQMKGFISEGSNLLLLRLLSIKEPDVGTNLQFISLNSHGHLAAAIYEKLDQNGEVLISAGYDEKVMHFSRRIKSTSSDADQVWHSHHTRSGRILHRKQLGSPVSMTTEPVTIQCDGSHMGQKTSIFSLPARSSTEIAKSNVVPSDTSESSADSEVVTPESYLRNNLELKMLTMNFLQFLLLNKPTDIIIFSKEYFLVLPADGVKNNAVNNDLAPEII